MRETPLNGLRVLELSRILAGPWAGQIFADLGADVLKVESAAGDDTRGWGPPDITYRDGQSDAAYFHACNRGKRSCVVDFSKAEGQAKIQHLAKEADVLIENFKVGGLAKYGLDYESLTQINPRLIYCSITGFGQTGPYADRAGYDFAVQAMSGIMSVTGEADGDPQKIGIAFSDIFTGLYAVIAIQAALASRDKTGNGQYIDLALLDTSIGVLANQGLNYLSSGKVPGRLGNAHPNIVPYQVYKTADHPFVLAVGNDGQFQKLCEIIGQTDLADDEKYSTNANRVRHRDQLNQVLIPVFAKLRRDDILERLNSEKIPCGPVNTIAQAFDDPHVQSRQMQTDMPADSETTIPAIAFPAKFSTLECAKPNPSPRLGSSKPKWLPRKN